MARWSHGPFSLTTVSVFSVKARLLPDIPVARKSLTSASFMKQRAARRMRDAVSDDAASSRQHFADEMHALIAGADADQLAELMAEANAALPDDDERKICRADVRMLRRLAGQARTFSISLLEHAA